MEYEYIKTNEYVTENAVVTAYHPVLPPEEKERRQRALEEAAADFMRSILEKELEKENCNI